MSRRLALLQPVLLAALLFPVIPGCGESEGSRIVRASWQVQAIHDIKEIAKVIKSFYLRENRLPVSLEEIEGDFDGWGVPPDPWGNDHIYEVRSRHQFVIISPGRDGEKGGDGVRVIANLPLLWELAIKDYGALRDLSPLADAPWLRVLKIEGCSALDDLSPVASIKELRVMEIRSCRRITDLEPLAEASKLGKLKLRKCPGITSEAIEKLRKARPGLEIDFE